MMNTDTVIKGGLMNYIILSFSQLNYLTRLLHYLMYPKLSGQITFINLQNLMLIHGECICFLFHVT